MVTPAALISNSSETGQDNIITAARNGLDEKIQLEAKIIRILDGDTVEILYGQLPIKLRLEHIDCPEKRGKQPFGNRAKIVLSDLCFGQTVRISSDGKFDRNGRLIGVIFNKDNINVNKEMVKLGMAWHFKKYSDDMSYDDLEREAREAKVGLWSDPNPIAPWDYR
ncbi:thermonuclease family protein [Arenibacter aquaticus]|uniref:Thermonuclease family protein n=1 Tax=Arenibacter aquaticus TaxID=2489054 RepID=A0A430K4R9_9FLAO|nr:thermonuclease family protein [Arenibacter aquaticus]RTE53959.1 thermonuclease family protein [Arenibacter aquaticus]